MHPTSSLSVNLKAMSVESHSRVVGSHRSHNFLCVCLVSDFYMYINTRATLRHHIHTCSTRSIGLSLLCIWAIPPGIRARMYTPGSDRPSDMLKPKLTLSAVRDNSITCISTDWTVGVMRSPSREWRSGALPRWLAGTACRNELRRDPAVCVGTAL